MLITKKIEIDTGHRVYQHCSKCFNPHGHRYTIEVAVDDKIISTPGASDEGMVIDFSELKNILLEKIDAIYDHGFIIYEKDYKMRFALIDCFKILEDENMNEFLFENIKYFNKLLLQDERESSREWKTIVVDFIPTAENLAKHWYNILKKALDEVSIKIYHVKVWETPTSTAIYTLNDSRKEVSGTQTRLKFK